MQLVLVICLIASVLTTGSAQQWTTSIANRACYSVSVNPLSRNVVYVGNVSRTLFRSNDGGTTFEELLVGSGGGPSLITTLVVHPRDTAVVFAGGIAFAGLDRSSDGGQTWTNVLIDPIGARFEVVSSSAIAINPAYPDTMYVMRNNPAYLYRSINAGLTWDSAGAIAGLPSQGRIRALTIAPDRTNVLLAGGRSAYVRRSTDMGKTWAVVINDSGTNDAEIARFVWSPSTPGKVYAVAIIQNTSSGGLHVSTDWGQSWETMRFRDTSLYALEVQATPSGDEIFVGGNLLELYDGSIKGDSIIYRTVNGGTNWQNLGSVPWAENETGNIVSNVWAFAVTYEGRYPEMLMATESGLYRSTFITEVSERSAVRTTQPPTLYAIDNQLVLDTWQGAQGAFRVDVTSLTGSTLYSIECASGQQRVPLPLLSTGCYIVRAIGTNESVSSVVMLGN
ncbi:MAG: sialidase family protein [bacterium]|nr:sialidase family protein [bacterium]